MTNQASDLKIERVKLFELKADPNNAREHGEDNLKAIIHSLDKFGQVKPIVVDADGTIYAGNGTYMAAQLLEWQSVDVVRLPADWSEEKKTAYALADNRTGELAEWDQGVLGRQLVDLDAQGWDIKELGFPGIPDVENLITPSGDKIDRNDPAPREDKMLTCPKCGFVWQDVRKDQA